MGALRFEATREMEDLARHGFAFHENMNVVRHHAPGMQEEVLSGSSIEQILRNGLCKRR
ncbi:MAG: hypothetical protein WB995_19295 [Candidatus Acidiferrales bacterium]